MINISDYDFTNNNIWDLNELKYCGKLYHYTNDIGCTGIFCPKTSNGNIIPLPENCISLRFTKISAMDRNDKNERNHICDTVKEVIQRLLNEPKESEKYITQEFADIVLGFKPNGIGWYIGISDVINKELGNNQISAGYDKIDYYVACFSTNPDNKYIERRFKYPIRLSFERSFVNPDEKKACMFNMPGYYKQLFPYCNISDSFLIPYFRKVLYDDTKKNKLIEKRLLEIYNTHSEKKDIENQLEDMYSLYDAFFKRYADSENDYWREEEVRLVFRIAPKNKNSTLRQNGFVFDKEIRNGKEVEYLYIPISKEFLIGGEDNA